MEEKRFGEGDMAVAFHCGRACQNAWESLEDTATFPQAKQIFHRAARGWTRLAASWARDTKSKRVRTEMREQLKAAWKWYREKQTPVERSEMADVALSNPVESRRSLVGDE